jgi:hypothetical protein
MATQSTDEVILKAAWNLLWNANTKYYLPNVMKNGLKFNNINIPPLEGSSVSDIGPVSLFKEPVLGYISLKMNNNKINGLPSITNGGFSYNDSTKTLTLTIGFGQLIFSGNYEVDSGGVVGCAIGAANGLLGGARLMAAAGASNDNIDMAYQYRDKLSDPSNPNGNVLVDAYYMQNDTLNSIVLADNAVVNGKNNPSNGFFHNTWLTYQTNGKDTSYFMNNTSNAAKNPDDGNTGFNNEDYNMHGFYMETVLTLEATSLQKLGDPRGTELYDSITKNSDKTGTSLLGEAQSYNGNSINNYMGYVKNGGSQSLAAHELTDVQSRKMLLHQQVYEKAVAAHEEWIANNRHEEYLPGAARFASTGDISQITGHFTDSFTQPSITMTATIALQGANMVVTVTDLKGKIPDLHVTLTPDHASELNTKVQNAIANAAFMQNLMRSKIISGMDSDDVKKYLSDRINDAIKKIFG